MVIISTRDLLIIPGLPVVLGVMGGVLRMTIHVTLMPAVIIRVAIIASAVGTITMAVGAMGLI